MKSLLLAALLLLVPATVHAQEQPNLFVRLQACTWYGIKATEYSIIARLAPSEKDFDAVISQDVDSLGIQNGAKQTLIQLSHAAWQLRDKLMPADVGMTTYQSCKAKNNAEA